MASRWHCKVLDEERGPISFPELVELVRAGTIREDDYVRREGIVNWERASAVVGLFRAAKGTSSQQISVAPTESQDAQPIQISELSRVNELFPQSSEGLRKIVRFPAPLIGAAFALLIVGGISLAGWLVARHGRYPEPLLGRGGRSEFRASLLERVRTARPEIPSIRGLEPRVPKLIPGLEMIEPAYAPTLTTDMRTIVFSRKAASTNGYDLQIANRASTGDPFGQTQAIATCNSQYTDSFPSISPNGLELLFVRFDRNPQLFYSCRDSRTADFSEAIPWEAPLTISENMVIGDPQFVDSMTVKFQLRTKTDNTTEVFYARRPSAKMPFESARILLYADGGAPQFLSASGLRSYYGWDQGLFVSARLRPEDTLGVPVLICNSDVSGEVDGPVWVAPLDDVIFFCSPGIGKRRGSAQRLWMIEY